MTPRPNSQRKFELLVSPRFVTLPNAVFGVSVTVHGSSWSHIERIHNMSVPRNKLDYFTKILKHKRCLDIIIKKNVTRQVAR